MINSTKVFIDGGNPEETRRSKILPFKFEGQTTNPTLIVRNPVVQNRLNTGEKYSLQEINDFYKTVVEEIDTILPQSAISIEVYADSDSTAEDLFLQGKEYSKWVRNAYIKYPITKSGLNAAKLSVAAGLRVNMTLCFSEEQAAAVYVATKGAKKGQVLISPFVGRLDDIGQDGISLIENISRLYSSGDGHVEVLAASIRSTSHLKRLLELSVDIITAPIELFEKYVREQSLAVDVKALEEIPYVGYSLEKNIGDYHIHHPLTDVGLEKFVKDWKSILREE
jgi:transaldolase